MFTLTRREFLELGLAAALFPSPGRIEAAPPAQAAQQFEFPLTFPASFSVSCSVDEERRLFLPLIYDG